jgi:hypothetical protein
MMSIKSIALLLALCAAFRGMAQDTLASRFTIIDISKDSGTVLIRSHESAWLKLFKPDALEFAGLKIGDTIEVSNTLQQVKRVKNEIRRYPLLEPYLGNPCCEVVGPEPLPSKRIYVATNSDGGRFRFELPDTIAVMVSPGFRLFTSPTHGYAMISLPRPTDSTQHIVYGFPILAASTH